ncbi:hypothetical protein O3P69_000027 [Scylla paramamosain]|uniref:Uncharacterized protein n=1 Tax=Scylla paramamosain TaxID=85552 RepID=A0AAW0UYG9_SCYPA
MKIQPIVVAVVVVLVVLVTTTSAVVIDKPSGETFSASSTSSNSLPAPSSQYGPPPAPPSPDVNLQYGPPPPRPPSFNYGPPPLPPAPPAGNSFSLKPNKYKFYSNALSLFDGECGHWKALSTFLLAVGAATGLGLLFRAWPLNFKILDFTDEETTARLTDPVFLSSVFDQVADISRVLMNIKEANYDYKEN